MKILLIALAVAASAAEHPEHPEHPGGAPSQAEKREEKIKPETHLINDLPESREGIERYFSDVVMAHVKTKSKSGAYPIKDEVTGKVRELQLTRIHKDKIVKLSPDEAFACSDFKTFRGGTDKVDLDFYVKRQGETWLVDRVLIHKINGKPRFQYNKANQIVPVK
jgi:hypothetical protein